MRARYWDEALKVHAVSPWVGTGAGAYATARTRFRTDTLAVRHAHGYVVQTLADLGWSASAVSLLALFAWLVARGARARAAAARSRAALGRRARRPRRRSRSSCSSSACTRTIDWTWFVPANAALRAAVRGLGRRARPAARAARARAGARGAACPRRAARARPPIPTSRPRRRVPVSGAWVAAALVVAFALAASWSACQPVRAVHAGDAAFDRLDAGAPAAAASIARIEAERNPLSVDPLFDLAAIEQARGRTAAGRRSRSSAPSACSPPTPRRGAASATCAWPRSTTPAAR